MQQEEPASSPRLLGGLLTGQNAKKRFFDYKVLFKSLQGTGKFCSFF